MRISILLFMLIHLLSGMTFAKKKKNKDIDSQDISIEHQSNVPNKGYKELIILNTNTPEPIKRCMDGGDYICQVPIFEVFMPVIITKMVTTHDSDPGDYLGSHILTHGGDSKEFIGMFPTLQENSEVRHSWRHVSYPNVRLEKGIYILNHSAPQTWSYTNKVLRQGRAIIYAVPISAINNIENFNGSLNKEGILYQKNDDGQESSHKDQF